MVPVCFWERFLRICGTFAPLPGHVTHLSAVQAA